MPIYEFTCNDCGRLTSIFTKGVNVAYEAKCQHCSSTDLTRAISRFAYHKSEQTILEEYGIPGVNAPLSQDQYRDPRQIGRWAERRLEDMGIEMPEEGKRMFEAAREGEMPDSLEGL